MSQQLPCIFIIKALVLSCGRVELKLRQGGAKTPCRWSSRSDLYKYFEWKLNWPDTCDDLGKVTPTIKWRKNK